MEVRELELYFNNGTSKPGFAVDDDYTMQEIFEQLADQHVFDAGKPMSEVMLVNTRTSERYRYNDARKLRDLGVQTGDIFQVMYDANVAADPTELELYFNNGTSKPGFAVDDDYTMQEIFEQLADQHVFDASKPMSEVMLVNTRTSERYRYNDARKLRDLGVQTGDIFQVMYDANVAGN